MRRVRFVPGVASRSWGARCSTAIARLMTPCHHCSQARGEFGGRSGLSRCSQQTGHRASCLASRRAVKSSTGGDTLRRRAAQYRVRSGSSGDAPPATS